MLAKVLETNDTILSIDLDNNSIGDDGAKSIAIALETNKKLIEIGLSQNNIGDEGVKSIISVLLTNKVIQSILLSDNNYTKEVAKSLFSMLENNYTLLSIDFDHINDTSIKKYTKRNKSLEWEKVYPKIINMCIGMYALQFPNYVLLEIFDRITHWENGINRYKKITLIENVNRSIRKILEKRTTTNKEIKI